MDVRRILCKFRYVFHGMVYLLSIGWCAIAVE